MILADRITAAAILLLLTLCSGGVAFAAPPPAITPFFGHYEGKVIVDGDGETTSRDLAVTIEPDGDRFRITWSTATRLADGTVNHKSYAISFDPTQRPGIFGSAMRSDMFGHRVPLDPLKGDPFVWCRIAGKVLTVYALLITDTGGYDLQVYERTLTDTGLRLRFSRLREGEPPHELTAVLERVADGKSPN